MAVKKPIVITNGQLEQIQTGDTLDLGNVVTRNNSSGGAMIVGHIVYITGVNVDLAQADAQATVRVAGFVITGGADATPVDIKTEGIVTLEDVIEELVGEITDEHDVDKESIKRIDKKTIEVAGDTTIRSINDFFNCSIPMDAENSFM